MIRIGQGFDVHATQAGGRLVLGGVEIPAEFGLRAHSDGDVVLHAVCDALLGALALGDIGRHFPDDDPAWANADSRELLRRVVGMLAGRDWHAINIDLTIIAERPRLAPHVAAMRASIADLLGVDADAVSVKATTHEGLGPLGQGAGIAVHAVALIGRDA